MTIARPATRDMLCDADELERCCQGCGWSVPTDRLDGDDICDECLAREPDEPDEPCERCRGANCSLCCGGG